jgi:hypothetical protein
MTLLRVSGCSEKSVSCVIEAACGRTVRALTAWPTLKNNISGLYVERNEKQWSWRNNKRRIRSIPVDQTMKKKTSQKETPISLVGFKHAKRQRKHGNFRLSGHWSNETGVIYRDAASQWKIKRNFKTRSKVDDRKQSLTISFSAMQNEPKKVVE